MDPIALIQETKQAAHKVSDANAGICFLALTSTEGKASVRTLVLRNINRNEFTLFINTTSPKWEMLKQNNHYELLLWYPSQQMQFRLSGSQRLLAYTDIKDAWKYRPEGSKLMDQLYAETAQSEAIVSQQWLKNKIDTLKKSLPIAELSAPPEAAGAILLINQVEVLNLNNEDRIHDRKLYQLKNDVWHQNPLMP